VLESLFSVGPFPWLSSDTLARISVIGVALWSSTGWHAVIYLAYLQSIPADYYESATVDGSSPRQQFFHITLPLLTPAIVISQFLLLTSGLRVYDLPFTLTKGGPGYATTTITQSIITNGVAQGRYGLASALSVLFTVSVAVLVVVQLLLSRRLERRVS
jgi:multiple sugar transport system permease protein/raffinose/stachyose/melibiose transport system permease protein